jgi:hypothetical protein
MNHVCPDCGALHWIQERYNASMTAQHPPWIADEVVEPQQ